MNPVVAFPWLRDQDPNTYLLENESWVDCLPQGWQSSFLEVCQEITKVLQKYRLNHVHFVLEQVKEKFGAARVYWTLAIEAEYQYYEMAYKEIDALVSKYENATKSLCHSCGVGAKYRSKGYRLPWCQHCAGEYYTEQFNKDGERNFWKLFDDFDDLH